MDQRRRSGARLMRVGPVAPWSAGLSAQLSQTVVRAAAHRSNPTCRPVQPASAAQGGLTLGRASPHTFDIRV